MSKHNRTTEEVVRGFVLKDDPFLKSAYELTDREKVFVDEYLSNGFDEREASFKAVNSFGKKSPHPKTNRDYWKREGYKLLNIPRVKEYIQHHSEQAELKIGKPVTIESVVEVLGNIMYDDTAENKDRIKAGEVLLKHLNGFEKHNQSKAPKQLTFINNMSEEELELELSRTMKSTKDTKKSRHKHDDLDEAEIIE